MQRLGLLTGGGDAPGLNAVIRAAVKTACSDSTCELVGIQDGFDGLLPGGSQRVTLLTPDTVRGLVSRGGTILGAAAARLARQGGWGRMVGLRGETIVDVSLAEAIAVPKRVDPAGEAICTARGIGIVFG